MLPQNIYNVNKMAILSSLIAIQGVVLSVAFMTQAERKVMAGMQRRIGPNKVGWVGILQPIADGVKQILKETVLPIESSYTIFQQAPLITFYLALQNWIIIPLDYGIAITELQGGGIQIIIAISELGIYGVIYSGWSSNSKYPFIGAQRSTAQLISYSVSLSLIMLTVIFTVGTIDLFTIMIAQNSVSLVFPQFPMAFLFIISAVAETNRSPFDLPEAESELVAGFMTEHSATPFAMFFQAEYTNILTISTIGCILFIGISMATPIIFFMIWLRASLARQRFDQQLKLGWAYFLPFTIGFIIFLPPFLYTFNILVIHLQLIMLLVPICLFLSDKDWLGKVQ